MTATPYGLDERPEILSYIPAQSERILDVGCGHGAFGRTLRTAFPGANVIAIEPDPIAAREATHYYDRVIVGTFPEAAPTGQVWDAIVFNDVLEHIVDPWEILRFCRKLIRPGGRVVASIPNIRYIPILWTLAIHGHWDYTDRGTLDRTHLRFFTRSSIFDMFDQSGYRIDRIEGVHSVSGRRWIWARFLPGKFADIQWLQFVISAQPI